MRSRGGRGARWGMIRLSARKAISEVDVMTEPKNMPTQHVQAYKDACDNLIYLKREQFQITYYTWLLLAALYILAHSADGTTRIVLLVGTLVVGALSIWTLWS